MIETPPFADKKITLDTVEFSAPSGEKEVIPLSIIPESLSGLFGVKKLDDKGGEIPSNVERAKKVDLITLPEGVEGTNCGNCKFVIEKGDGHFCDHPEIKLVVNQRNCCAKWDAGGVIRAWKHEGKSLSWEEVKSKSYQYGAMGGGPSTDQALKDRKEAPDNNSEPRVIRPPLPTPVSGQEARPNLVHPIIPKESKFSPIRPELPRVAPVSQGVVVKSLEYDTKAVVPYRKPTQIREPVKTQMVDKRESIQPPTAKPDWQEQAREAREVVPKPTKLEKRPHEEEEVQYEGGRRTIDPESIFEYAPKRERMEASQRLLQGLGAVENAPTSIRTKISPKKIDVSPFEKNPPSNEEALAVAEAPEITKEEKEEEKPKLPFKEDGTVDWEKTGGILKESDLNELANIVHKLGGDINDLANSPPDAVEALQNKFGEIAAKRQMEKEVSEKENQRLLEKRREIGRGLAEERDKRGENWLREQLVQSANPANPVVNPETVKEAMIPKGERDKVKTPLPQEQQEVVNQQIDKLGQDLEKVKDPNLPVEEKTKILQDIAQQASILGQPENPNISEPTSDQQTKQPQGQGVQTQVASPAEGTKVNQPKSTQNAPEGQEQTEQQPQEPEDITAEEFQKQLDKDWENVSKENKPLLDGTASPQEWEEQENWLVTQLVPWRQSGGVYGNDPNSTQVIARGLATILGRNKDKDKITTLYNQVKPTQLSTEGGAKHAPFNVITAIAAFLEGMFEVDLIKPVAELCGYLFGEEAIPVLERMTEEEQKEAPKTVRKPDKRKKKTQIERGPASKTQLSPPEVTPAGRPTTPGITPNRTQMVRLLQKGGGAGLPKRSPNAPKVNHAARIKQLIDKENYEKADNNIEEAVRKGHLRHDYKGNAQQKYERLLKRYERKAALARAQEEVDMMEAQGNLTPEQKKEAFKEAFEKAKQIGIDPYDQHRYALTELERFLPHGNIVLHQEAKQESDAKKKAIQSLRKADISEDQRSDALKVYKDMMEAYLDEGYSIGEAHDAAMPELDKIIESYKQGAVPPKPKVLTRVEKEKAEAEATKKAVETELKPPTRETILEMLGENGEGAPLAKKALENAGEDPEDRENLELVGKNVEGMVNRVNNLIEERLGEVLNQEQMQRIKELFKESLAQEIEKTKETGEGDLISSVESALDMVIGIVDFVVGHRDEFQSLQELINNAELLEQETDQPPEVKELTQPIKDGATQLIENLEKDPTGAKKETDQPKPDVRLPESWGGDPIDFDAIEKELGTDASETIQAIIQKGLKKAKTPREIERVYENAQRKYKQYREWAAPEKADELIKKYAGFVSTVEDPHPAAGKTGEDALSDLAVVISGSKPAALISKGVIKKNEELYVELLRRAKELGLKVAEVPGKKLVAIGRENNVDKLVETYKEYSGKKPDEKFDRIVGMALGVSKEAIESYLENVYKKNKPPVKNKWTQIEPTESEVEWTPEHQELNDQIDRDIDSSNIEEGQKLKNKGMVKRILGHYNPVAIKKLKNAKFVFHPNSETLVREIAKMSPVSKGWLDQGYNVAGAYMPAEGQIHIGGNLEHKPGFERFMDLERLEEIMDHEIGHFLGKGIDTSPEWFEALKEGNPPSQYAKSVFSRINIKDSTSIITAMMEDWTEFLRKAKWAAKYGKLDELEQRNPKRAAVVKQHGLWPEHKENEPGAVGVVETEPKAPVEKKNVRHLRDKYKPSAASQKVRSDGQNSLLDYRLPND